MQNLLRWSSVTLFTLLGVFLILFGALYANVRDFLPFHAAAVPADALDDMRPLYLALMKLIGGSSAALGALGVYVTLGPVRRGGSAAAVAVASTFAAPLLMAAFVAETLRRTADAPTSWHIMGVLLAITAAALIAHLASMKVRAA